MQQASGSESPDDPSGGAAGEVAPPERLSFLAEASRVLASSLDYETTLANVARLAASALAGWCTIHQLQDDGSIHRIEMAHADPAKRPLIEQMLRYPPIISPRSQVTAVLRTGRAALTPDVPASYPETIAQDAEHLRTLRELGFTSMLVVPLVARGRTFGAITLVSGEPGRRYGPEDLALAEELAGRAALAVDNARLYREAQDAARMRQEFLASASHDLKSPLTYIRATAHMLELRATQGGEVALDRLAEGLAGIVAAATRMSALIDEMLDVAHMQTGEPLELARQVVNLVDLARMVADRHQQTSSRHRVVVRPAVPSLTGVWDAARLERVLDNLLGNALKYSPGGGEIALTVARTTGPARDWAVVSVQDSGLGIPRADLERIFERFQRGENVVGRIAGTGIGLAGARQIVEQHGGSLTVESQEGVGSVFTVRLPL
jgi:signal transduction histidine kinase